MSLKGGVARKGAVVTFSKSTPGTYDPNTDMTTGGSTLTVAGRAMKIAGDPVLYAALSLIESENPTLLFTPDVAGVMPALGSSVVWAGESFTVKNINTLAMNGTATAARIVVSK
jgi:hypothetical protein